MSSYILRAFDQLIWDAFKLRCQAEGHSIRWVLTSLIQQYISKGLG